MVAPIDEEDDNMSPIGGTEQEQDTNLKMHML